MFQNFDRKELPCDTPPKSDNIPLEMDGWKIVFLLGWEIFRGYANFREHTLCFICALPRAETSKKLHATIPRSPTGAAQHCGLGAMNWKQVDVFMDGLMDGWIINWVGGWMKNRLRAILSLVGPVKTKMWAHLGE